MSDRTINVQDSNRVTRPATLSHFDIGTLPIGQVLEVVTHSGSKYWITRVAGTHRTPGLVYGVSVTTNSHRAGRTYMPPRECWIDRYIRRDSAISMCGTGVKETSYVISWRML